jgi:ubiquinone/menaquinone biosynthesis C-methylase UbiE
MSRNKESKSPKSDEVCEHYASGYEAGRLHTTSGKLDRERSREILQRFLPPPPTVILDVGGGPGGHACWLAKQGYEVHLIDIVPLHVQLAKEASALQADAPLASASVGDACSLSWSSESAQAMLLFGPLYHLTDKKDRMQALLEAHRVLEPGGVLLAAGISRFASLLDGIRAGFLKDPLFAEIVDQDLKNGQHKNPTDKTDYFMEAFFHHPNELLDEVRDAGFDAAEIFGIEGPCWLLSDFDDWWKNDELRRQLLQIAHTVENEPSLLGMSSHLMVVAAK